MSSTLSFPIGYILDLFVDANSGETTRELKECIECTHSLLVTDEGIRLTPYWGITLANGSSYELYISNSKKDSFFQDRIIFNGFHSTALAIIEVLGIPKEEYEFVG